MQINIHQADSRGTADLDWLYSRHTYSFSSYQDAERMGFGKLRVINDDIVQPSMGFGTHPHENMEIVSIPLRGSLRHKDSIGNEHIIPSGEIQIMSAGTGIHHSEYNNSDTDEVNFLQIWVLPKLQNITPRYDQKRFDSSKRKNKVQLVVSPSGNEDSITINQDAYFSLADLDDGHSLTYQMNIVNNGLYVFVISGAVTIGDSVLEQRDGAEISDVTAVSLIANNVAQVLFIEVPLSRA